LFCPVYYIKNWTFLLFLDIDISVKITDYIANTIDRLPKGYVFTYEDFIGEVNKKEAVIKALNRMAASGKIAKLSKGKYYKPEKTVFGELEPDQYQVVKDLLEKDGKLIGYITGYGIFNKLGLTTQVNNTIQIGTKEVRPPLQRDRYKISFIKQKNTITKEYIPLLQILDAVRYIKTIPDATIASSCTRLLAILKELSTEERALLSKLAMKYPPSSRALIGAMLEYLGEVKYLEMLRQSLNPITVYKLRVPQNMLPTAESWNIK
jgi:hypothetical protein